MVYIYVADSLCLASVDLMQLAPKAAVLCGTKRRLMTAIARSRSLKVTDFVPIRAHATFYQRMTSIDVTAQTVSELSRRTGSNCRF